MLVERRVRGRLSWAVAAMQWICFTVKRQVDVKVCYALIAKRKLERRLCCAATGSTS